MVKKEKKSPRGDKRRKDAPALIAELFRSLPDKRYSVKSLMAAVGATTRDGCAESFAIWRRRA